MRWGGLGNEEGFGSGGGLWVRWSGLLREDLVRSGFRPHVGEKKMWGRKKCGGVGDDGGGFVLHYGLNDKNRTLQC